MPTIPQQNNCLLRVKFFPAAPIHLLPELEVSNGKPPVRVGRKATVLMDEEAGLPPALNAV
jgi:hypothetical protein